MEIPSYIKELLYRYECVILPGFGAFLTQYQSARIDDEQQFHPPGKTLSFNRQLQTNDGILANYVATAQGCSYELALQRIRNYTGEISLKLSEQETVSIDHLGTFHLNEGRKVQFTPYSTENFSRDAFGLVTFISPAIQRKEAVADLELKSIPREKTKYPFLRYAAIGLIAITVGGFSGLKIYENEVASYNFAERQKANQLLENQIQEATFVLPESFSAFTISVPKKTGKYHIVAGAYRIEENAHHKVEELTQMGYPARLINVNKYGLHQVVYSSHEERLEALQALREVKKIENRQAWMLVQELP